MAKDKEIIEESKEETPKREVKKSIKKWTYDMGGGKVMFETEGYSDGEELEVEVNGQKTRIQSFDGLAIYSKGASFKEFPAVKY